MLFQQYSKVSRVVHASRPVHRVMAGLSALSMALALGLPGQVQAQGAELAGVQYPATIKVEGVPLVLNGSGISYRAVAKVYTVGLYISQKSDKPAVILGMNGPKQLRFVMLQGMRIDELGRLITSGIEHNSNREEFYRMIPAIRVMGEQFAHIKRMSAGDTFSIEWVPARGSVFVVNGQPVGLPIADPGFFVAVLRVWLGNKPSSPGLKNALLDYQAPPVLNALD